MTAHTRRPTTRAAARTDWQDYANCRTADPELFFPTGTGGLLVAQERDAKRICADCIVRTQCLDWAVTTHQYAGVWGGQSERDRQGMYEAKERSFDRCLNAQAWIEKQLACGRTQKSIAKAMGVDHGVLNRAVKQMAAEREALAVVGQEAAA